MSAGLPPGGPGDEEPQVLPTVPAGSPGDRVLRESMRVLRDRTEDREAAALFDDILRGRRSARDLLASPTFDRLALEGLRQYEEKVAAMTEEERAAFEAEGVRVLGEEPPEA